jgi:hypothetical protein
MFGLASAFGAVVYFVRFVTTTICVCYGTLSCTTDILGIHGFGVWSWVECFMNNSMNSICVLNYLGCYNGRDTKC